MPSLFNARVDNTHSSQFGRQNPRTSRAGLFCPRIANGRIRAGPNTGTRVLFLRMSHSRGFSLAGGVGAFARPDVRSKRYATK